MKKAKKPRKKKVGEIKIRQSLPINGIILDDDFNALFIPADMLLPMAFQLVSWGLWFSEQNKEQPVQGSKT